MQTQGSADLMAIGQHCAWPACGQLDFLPFRCGCGGVFCLEHRSAAAHNCAQAAADCKQVIVCPICAQGVELSPTEDPNLVFDRHQRAGCDPSNYARVHKRPKCPVKGCKERLTTINTFTCKDCKIAVCLRHRLAIDHSCSGPSAAAAAAASAGQRQSASAAASAALSAAAAAGRSFGAKASTLVSDWTAAAAATTAAPAAGRSRSGGPQHQHHRQQPVAADPANSLRGSAHRRQQQLQQQGAERCPQCGAVFAGVQELIQHVERSHTTQQQQHQQAPGQPRGAGGSGDGDEVFSCPRCQARFTDAVMLVSHSEACGRGEGNCALC